MAINITEINMFFNDLYNFADAKCIDHNVSQVRKPEFRHQYSRASCVQYTKCAVTYQVKIFINKNASFLFNKMLSWKNLRVLYFCLLPISS